MCVLYNEEIPMQSEINYPIHTKLLNEDFDMSTIHTTPIQNQKQETNSP